MPIITAVTGWHRTPLAQTSSFPDGLPYAPLRLGLTGDYVPPNPQSGLFDSFDLPEDDDSDPG
jgi:hypothetical protein